MIGFFGDNERGQQFGSVESWAHVNGKANIPTLWLHGAGAVDGALILLSSSSFERMEWMNGFDAWLKIFFFSSFLFCGKERGAGRDLMGKGKSIRYLSTYYFVLFTF